MVVRAYGSANGSKIILTREEGDRWEAVVPFDKDGEYVVEFFAEDEAGNVGYMCTILFAVSHHRNAGVHRTERIYRVRKKMQQYSLFPTGRDGSGPDENIFRDRMINQRGYPCI